MTFDKLFSRLILLEAEERHTPRGAAEDPKSVYLGKSHFPQEFPTQSSMPSGIELPEPERFERGSLIERKPDLKQAEAVMANMTDEEKALHNSIARLMRFAADSPSDATALNAIFEPYIRKYSEIRGIKQMADTHAIRTGEEKSGKELRKQVPKRIDQLLDLEAQAEDMANTAEREGKEEKRLKALELRDDYRRYIQQYEEEVGAMHELAKKLSVKLIMQTNATIKKIADFISDAQPASEAEHKPYIRNQINNFVQYIEGQRDTIRNGEGVSGRAQKWWFLTDPVNRLYRIWLGVKNRGMNIQSSVSTMVKGRVVALVEATKAYLESLSSPREVRTGNVQLSSKLEAARKLHNDALELKYILEVVSGTYAQRLSVIKNSRFNAKINSLHNVAGDKKNELKQIIEELKIDDSRSSSSEITPETRAKQLILSIVNELSQRKELRPTLQQQSMISSDIEKERAREKQIDAELERLELQRYFRENPTENN